MPEVCVALDLETTGPDPRQDEILEIGAVKFASAEVLGTWQTLVKPYRPIPYRVYLLSGIRQEEVDQAPPLAAVAGPLQAFLGFHPLVGQSIGQDASFLEAKGMVLPNPHYDTHELGRLLLPDLPETSLASLARHLGIPYPSRHRALADAQAAREVFLALLERAAALEPRILEEILRLTQGTAWPLWPLFEGVLRAQVQVTAAAQGPRAPWAFGASSRAEPPLRPLVPAPEPRPLDLEHLGQLLSPAGPFAQHFPQWEERLGQQAMLQAVGRTFNEGGQLLVEAGTGIGKSLAYLLPAILFASTHNVPVVVSTNTINLQEQLISKDLPDLLRVLRAGGESQPSNKRDAPQAAMASSLRVAQVKGRANYLCPWRLEALRRGDGLPPEELGVLLRLLVWASHTETGDRAELTLSAADAALWRRVSAEGCLPQHCALRQGDCFLQRARHRAESAHLIVVNHALLLSDMAADRRILPESDYLIVDEAHHLEEEATRQLGYSVAQGQLGAFLDDLSAGSGPRPGGILSELPAHLRGSTLSPQRREELLGLATAALPAVARARGRARQFSDLLATFVREHGPGEGEYERVLRLTKGVRAQPGWGPVELAWENLSLALKEVEEHLIRLQLALEPLSESHLLAYQELLGRVTALELRGQELRQRMHTILMQPQTDTVYWASLTPVWEEVVLHAAPLQVGPLLERDLFTPRRSAVLTSATLTTEGGFRYIKERLGLAEAQELLVGSPFDYARSTLIYLPTDLPEPAHGGYQRAVEGALVELCRATAGRTLVLFTSHAALHATYRSVKGPLEAQGILVLGQGIDGPPKQLLEALKANPRTVLLGTSSFWEGVDVVGEALSVLVMARLPFSVPTDPLFAARSELFEEPFLQYALPQAVLRFKQGFGRLIRSRQDRGVLVVLDRRLESRGYGRAFLASLPPCRVERGPLRDLPKAAAAWLGGQGDLARGSSASFPEETSHG